MGRTRITEASGDTDKLLDGRKNLLTTSESGTGPFSSKITKVNKKVDALQELTNEVISSQDDLRELTNKVISSQDDVFKVQNRIESQQSTLHNFVSLGFIFLLITVAAIVLDFFYFKTTLERTANDDLLKDLNVNVVLQTYDENATTTKFNFAR